MSSANSMWKSLKFITRERVNSLPGDKILSLSKLKAFLDGIFILSRFVQFLAPGRRPARLCHGPVSVLFDSYQTLIAMATKLKTIENL